MVGADIVEHDEHDIAGRFLGAGGGGGGRWLGGWRRWVLRLRTRPGQQAAQQECDTPIPQLFPPHPKTVAQLGSAGSRGSLVGLAFALAIALTPGAGCKKSKQEAPAGAETATPGTTAAKAEAEREAQPTLIAAYSQFKLVDGNPVPGAAKLTLMSPDAAGWNVEDIEDPMSNVFHKALPWRGGILTVGGMAAALRHWTRSPGDDGWTAETLWQRSWGGKFDRLRDIEVGDVDGDGADELVIATHDQGVVAVGDEDAGTWTFTELDQTPDTFVHEIEIGDVDGDGALEFYATVSARNRSDGVSQPGGVYRYTHTEKGYERSTVVAWDKTHAKEILVADVDGDDKPELYVAREAETIKRGDERERVTPVRIGRYAPGADGSWKETGGVALEDSQTRFLVAGDVDGDGASELVAAAMTSGLWRIELEGDGLVPYLIDGQSGGFEHATVLADIDGQPGLEIYVAADRERELRRYVWRDGRFEREVIAATPAQHLTWQLAVGEL